MYIIVRDNWNLKTECGNLLMGKYLLTGYLRLNEEIGIDE